MSQPKSDMQTISEMHKVAIESRNHSHSPYSQYKVGASIRTSSGQIFGGCNIENASYGGTVCAERVAIWKAVSELGSLEISEVVVVTDQATPWPPCGFCRQVMAEFASPTTKVHLANLQGIQKTFTFGELLPEAFYPTHLKK